jgi:hypothetical protein
MSYTIRRGLREDVHLIVGLAGGTSSGKTFSAMRLASGITQGKPFAVIDTEGRRALHYAPTPSEISTDGRLPFGKFTFDHLDLKAPFSPENYLGAIRAVASEGYGAIVVDSASHEWEGIGGVLEMQEEELKRRGGGDNSKMLSWIEPKAQHREFMQELLQIRAHLILCFRAHEKIEMGKDEKGKTVVKAKVGLTGRGGWFPICEKNMPFELTAYFLMLASSPGIAYPIKLEEQHKNIFPGGELIDEECGKRLTAWATITPSAPTAPAAEGVSPATPQYLDGIDDGDLVLALKAWAESDAGTDDPKTVAVALNGQASIVTGKEIRVIGSPGWFLQGAAGERDQQRRKLLHDICRALESSGDPAFIIQKRAVAEVA